MNKNNQIEHPMIEVDGVMKHRHNSLGQPIHHTDEGIRNFHRWFGDSSTVDEHGRPKVFYHGSNYTDPKTGEGFSAHRGILWASETPELANQYAEARQDRGAASSVIPIYVRSKKLFDADKLPSTSKISHFYSEVSKQSPGIDMKELGDLADTVRQGASEEESGPHYSRHDFWYEPHFHFGSKGADAIMKSFELGGFSGIDSTETVSNYVNGDFEDKHHRTIGVFNPEDVKSVIGNSGAYSQSIHMHESMNYEMFLSEAMHGNYVAIKAFIPDDIKKFVKSLDMSVDPIEDQDLHATLIYSKGTEVDNSKIKNLLSKGRQEFTGTVKHISKFDSQKSSDLCVIVMEVESYDLEKLHNKLLKIGLKHSYEDYKPHVSLVYNIPTKEANEVIKKLNDFVDGKEITFKDFIVEELKKYD